MKHVLPLIVLTLAPCCAAAEDIERIWLTHKTNDPSKIVVNWMSDESGDSVVRFGLTAEYEETVRVDESTTMHHVEIPLHHRDAVYHYSVSTGDHRSADATFKAYPTDVLRVAVVADWQGKPDLSAIVKDDVHLLLTAGDNIASIWQMCGESQKDCVKPYADLIDAYPKLFRSTPFMPVLGNHDREIRPRRDKPPAEPVYDVDATAFRRCFELPGDEWKWHFDLPEFDLRLVALDFNHISDFGTTWQTCHAFGEDSEQFHWYEKLMENPPPFVVTLYNERNASIRNQAQKRWHDLFRRGTCCITGFGYFAERAEVDGFPYYNTSLNGRGTQYPDPQSKFLAGEDSYVLLTVERGEAMTVEIKSLGGEVLDRKDYEMGEFSGARRDDHGFLVHTIKSPYQAGDTDIRVLLPDRLEEGKQYPVVYVLPVEPGRETRYGDGLLEVQKHDLHNKHEAIFVAPTFSQLPWYADHPTKPEIRQETYFTNVVVPFIEKTYPASKEAADRLLLGFSKSGWGAWSLLLRHQDSFGRAAVWDAPLMMAEIGKYGTSEVLGTQENFERYRPADLLQAYAEMLRSEKRLVLTGYGNFRDHH